MSLKLAFTSSSNSEMSSSETLEIDPKGDLTLVLACQAAHETFFKQLYPSALENVSNYTNIRVRVSSKHLLLASRVFEVMMAGHFSEGQELGKTSSVEVDLSDDHPVALYTILLTLHCRCRSIPLILPLDVLIPFAVLVTSTNFMKLLRSTPIDGIPFKEEN